MSTLTGSRASERILETSPVHEGEEAEEYEWMIRRYGWLLNRPFVRLVGREARRRGLARCRVLDIGTGVGRVPIELAQRHPDWEIWAVDLAEDMLAKARENARQAGVADRVYFVRGSGIALPFNAGSFDLVLSHFTLHHIDRPAEMLDEVARVVKPDGLVLIKDIKRQPAWLKQCLLWFARHVMGYGPRLLRMYRESLDAGLTRGELEAAVAGSRLAGAAVRGFRGLDLVMTAGRPVAAPTWVADRWMRLATGLVLLLALGLGWLLGQAGGEPVWMAALAGLIALWQIGTALVDDCPFQRLLKRLGVQDRGQQVA
jgi:SAM-dependent methyltransferase